ncbi:uncharacterized protein LOC105188238 isoform X2 [Harpegnathos saltator]|nr:uncharacterized protein LOC105188238 isoform X2 [Harpegnathos saltator]
MRKPRKLHKLIKRRERTLNVCLPHTIKDKKEVEDLFVGDFHVKLPRQTSRSCHVVFSSMEEKVKNQKLVKNKTINGKCIRVQPLHDIVIAERNKVKKKNKKIFIPEIIPDIKITQTIFVANIIIGTKADEIKGTLPGCISVTLLKPYNNKFRGAIIKMENIQIAAEYLKKKHKWPIIKGHKVFLKPDTRTKHKKKASTGSIKIYDDAMEVSIKEECESDEEHKNSDCRESNDESS